MAGNKVRSLAQPEVLKSAVIASLATALVSYPRLALWQQRPYPLWSLVSMIFLGGTVLWAFVFGWHTKYTQRPVFTLKLEPWAFLSATLAAMLVAAVLDVSLDPALRLRAPEDYPASLEQWIAATLFGLSFIQLFLLFAPFAWSLRVFQSRLAAILFTVSFGAFVAVLKAHSSPAPIPSSLLSALIISRTIVGLLSLYFYLRGGVLLVCWWGLALQARLLLHLESGG
jgi:hypothetical protein